MRVKVKLLSPYVRVPKYHSMWAAGVDLQAAENGSIQPHSWQVVRTGIAVEIPPGYEGQIRPRSGLAAKHGITVLNAPGTVDADFRSEIGVLLMNNGEDVWRYEAGDRVAQLVFAAVAHAEMEMVEELTPTARGAGGWGSTGLR